MKAKLYSHKKMELFLDAVPARYEEKEGWRQRRRAEGEAGQKRRVRLSEMDSGSIVLAGRTGRGGEAEVV